MTKIDHDLSWFQPTYNLPSDGLSVKNSLTSHPMGHQPPSRVPPGVSQVLDRSVDVLSLSPSAGG